MGAVLVALEGFHYVGFPFVAKLATGQPLDSYLIDFVGSILFVLLGLLGCLAASLLASNLLVGRRFLQTASNKAMLGRI